MNTYENTGWPFPTKDKPLPAPPKRDKPIPFNPDNFEDAPL